MGDPNTTDQLPQFGDLNPISSDPGVPLVDKANLGTPEEILQQKRAIDRAAAEAASSVHAGTGEYTAIVMSEVFNVDDRPTLKLKLGGDTKNMFWFYVRIPELQGAPVKDPRCMLPINNPDDEAKYYQLLSLHPIAVSKIDNEGGVSLKKPKLGSHVLVTFQKGPAGGRLEGRAGGGTCTYVGIEKPAKNPGAQSAYCTSENPFVMGGPGANSSSGGSYWPSDPNSPRSHRNTNGAVSAGGEPIPYNGPPASPAEIAELVEKSMNEQCSTSTEENWIRWLETEKPAGPAYFNRSSADYPTMTKDGKPGLLKIKQGDNHAGYSAFHPHAEPYMRAFFYKLCAAPPEGMGLKFSVTSTYRYQSSPSSPHSWGGAVDISSVYVTPCKEGQSGWGSKMTPNIPRCGSTLVGPSGGTAKLSKSRPEDWSYVYGDNAYMAVTGDSIVTMAKKIFGPKFWWGGSYCCKGLAKSKSSSGFEWCTKSSCYAPENPECQGGTGKAGSFTGLKKGSLCPSCTGASSMKVDGQYYCPCGTLPDAVHFQTSAFYKGGSKSQMQQLYADPITKGGAGKGSLYPSNWLPIDVKVSSTSPQTIVCATHPPPESGTVEDLLLYYEELEEMAFTEAGAPTEEI